MKKIPLPVNEKEFEKIVKAVVKKLNLKSQADYDHAYAVVCNRLMHTDVKEASISIEELANCVWRNKSFQLCAGLAKRKQHELAVDQLIISIKSEPLDQNLWDQLNSWIEEGSEYAKKQKELLDQEKV